MAKEPRKLPFKQEIAKAVSQVLDTPLEQVLPLIETPPDPALGDYALYGEFVTSSGPVKGNWSVTFLLENTPGE